MTDADLPHCRNCFAVLGFITLTSGSKVPYTAPAAFQPRPTHAARKVGKAFVDGFVLRHAEQIPPGVGEGHRWATARLRWYDAGSPHVSVRTKP